MTGVRVDHAAMSSKPRILIVCTAGLARFVPALGAMAAIRAFHRDCHISLLAARETSAFALTAPYFDEVWSDDSAEARGLFQTLRGLWALRERFAGIAFERVYDLDCTTHSRHLFWAMYGRNGLSLKRKDIPWSGIISGTAFSHDDSQRGAMHLVDQWAAQLKVAGIVGVLRPDMSWVARQVQSFTVPFRMTEPFVLIAARAGSGRPWPAERIGDVARALAAGGQIPVLIGTDVAADVCKTVIEICPKTVDLTGRATINEMVFLAWAATAAVGPDNGIMHLTAAAGCRSVVLYDGASDPALVGQRGNNVLILRRPALSDIPAGEILAALRR